MAERILIEGGRVLDPARGVDGKLDVLIEDGKIVAVGPNLRGRDSATVIEGLRSDAGPIERLTMQRRQEGGRESGGRAKLSGRPCGSREQRHTK